MVEKMNRNFPINHYNIKSVLIFSFLLSISLFFYVQYNPNFDESLTTVKFTLKNYPKYVYLENILNDEEILKNKNIKKIFFIESHLEPERKFEDARQACSVESAARINTDVNVYFVFATNTSTVSLEYSEQISALSDYLNINFRYINPIEISTGHYLEEFFREDKVSVSQFKIAHRADAIRALIMSKYGGQYLDLDVFSLVPISEIKLENFGCVESKDIVNNAVLNFDVDKGKHILEEYARRLSKDYNPKKWAANGPAMFSEVLKTFCNDTTFDGKDFVNCSDFTIVPTSKCYEITNPEYRKFYEEEFRDEVLKRIKESQSYYVHIWNKMQAFGGKYYTLKSDSKSAYMELARENCPRVFKSIDKYF